ncbi:hypothetical protein [Seohaeicola zhoushanensis]|uniref:Uncharacterized protein n=1 Tax=Seohaeicola zhoushanensis TaxID=1569283 RepID=A0A8J3GW55_9RHOB|nr:hypothetical protein [Seohaeicola zhoushanensis]GHF44035.1 hypothetical protein GCM10017056_14960 [Seohaeicola zhoushanensis]
MPSDLSKLRKDLLDAETASDKRKRAAAFRAAVEAQLAALFDDPAFPARRRSFGVIRRRLGVFDDDPAALEAVLTGMGARAVDGAGDAALWELPAPPVPAPARRSSVARAAALSLLALLATTPAVVRLLRGSHADCLARAEGAFLEIIECHKRFDLLRRS